MKSSDFQLRGVGDPRLAVHATSALPAWLWSIDGAAVLWANPVGAMLFGAANSIALTRKTFGPADPHRRQVARLARLLPPGGRVRLERMRGFGAPLGGLMTCACARLEFADGGRGVLVVAMNAAGRFMPLVERLRRLVEDAPVPMAAFAPDGLFVGASEAARSLLGFRDLREAGLDQARSDALAQGRVETPIGIGHMVLQRIGRGDDTGLIALLEPGATEAAHQPRHVAPEAEAGPSIPASTQAEPVQAMPPEALTRSLPDYEQPALSNEAPAEFALFDAFAVPLEAEAKPPGPADVARDSSFDAVSSREPVPTSPENALQAEIPVDDASSEAVRSEEAAAEDIVLPQAEPISAAMVEPPSAAGVPAPRSAPLRFLWQIDAEGRFVLGSDEFIRLIGPHTAAGFGRPWSEIAREFSLDPDGRVARALASRDTWAGITVNWPVDGGERLAVELAGLPVYDRARNFAGFKGFGVCRDLGSLDRLEARRGVEPFTGPSVPESPPADAAAAGAGVGGADVAPATPPPSMQAEAPEQNNTANSPPNDLEKAVETPPNVVPFRPPGEVRTPALTPVENSAFNELARQLSERLEREKDAAAALPEQQTTQAAAEPPAPPALAQWLREPEPSARGDSGRDRTLLDLLPTGILIYRLDRLLYANPAFLARMGHASLHALEQAGGLDALYVEAGASPASSTPEAGTQVTISASAESDATEARLHTIAWDNEPAHALICAPAQAAAGLEAALIAPAEEYGREAEPEAGEADAQDLAAILDTTAEGIVMFDAEGNIHACNRSAEALFGYDGEALLDQNLQSLFAPESQGVVADYLDSLRSQNIESLLDHGREVLGRESKGGLIPLAMILGRTRPDGPNFFAVFRDLSQSRKRESDLRQAQKLANGAASAKADMLARISHEIRTPLNAIIGFAEVMISERFGALGNERYGEYMKDIRASGERVITIIDDLLELSRIETGKLDLNFANLNLNDLVESCVVVMQPQANRERIIIRTSLAHALPQVLADARAMRQITMNLIGNSIRLASAGGQVIVSTALTDRGEVALRIRDTGHGLSEREVAAAMEPFRTPPPPDAADSAALSLSLTKALVEANRARFNIKSAANSGTLIEVVFSQALARA